MADYSSGPGGVLYNTPSGPSGIFKTLDPAYQAQQLANQQTQLGLDAATAFPNGFPVDPRTGQPDLNAMSNTLAQRGDLGSALKFLDTGIRMQGINAALAGADALANGPGGGAQPAGGGPLSTLGASQPAAGEQGGASAPVLNSRGGNPTQGANPDVAGYIRSAFTARGINPNVALGVAGAEGLRGFDPSGSANPGDGNSSFGPFQLHMGGLAPGGNAVAGLGDDFSKATGLDPRDPSTWKQQVDFVADYVAQNGWGAFHGAKAAGIGNWTGIGNGQSGGGQVPAPTPAQGAAPSALPAGGQRSLISFGGPSAASAAPAPDVAAAAAAPPAAAAPTMRPVTVDPNSDTLPPGTVTDRQYQGAQNIIAEAARVAPADMDAQNQRALSLANAMVSRYQQQQSGAGAAPGPAAAPAGVVTDAQLTNARGLIKVTSGYDPQSLAPATRAALAAAQATVARAGQGQDASATVAGPASAGTAEGAPASSADERPMTGQHPFAPGGNGTRSAAVAPTSMQGQQMAAAGQLPADGVAPISFGGPSGGGPAAPPPPAAPQGGGAPVSFGAAPQAAPAAPNLGGVPPDAAAALQRLRSGQGSAADAQVWGAYQRTVGQGAAAAAAGPGAARPALPAGQGGSGPAMSGRPVVLDPSYGGMVPPQWQANPGAYVSAIRAQAMRVSAYGGNEAAAPLMKQAEDVANSIARSDITTPGMREYGLAVGQGFAGSFQQFQAAQAGDKANAENAARLAADTDPSRIDFAGRQAAATAAGGAPYKFVQTTPVPGGPTVFTSEADLAAGRGGPAVASQPAVFAQKQEALGKLDGEMQGQFQNRQIAQERLDAMSNLLETFQSGAGADAKAAAVAAVRAAGFNIPDSATASPAAVEQFSKNATANVFASAKDMGGRVLVTELDGLRKANANPNMQPASNAAILAQQKGLLNWEDQHYQDYSAWRQANPYATDASSFEQGWAKANPVGAYVDAARKDIAPLGAALPKPGQWVDGQAYIVNGQKVRWDAAAGKTVPFSGVTAPTLPGQPAQPRGAQQAVGQGQGQSAPPMAGARQAPDGNWYVSDPRRPGKFLQVSN